MKWFRFYHDAVNDPKVQRLSPALFKHWVNLLCISSQSDDRGTLPSVSDIAFTLRMKPCEAEKILSQLVKEGLFDLQQDGTFRAHNWTGRQRTSDDVATRVQRHRDAAQSQPSQSFDASRDTDGQNVTLHVTHPKRRVDTDTDTDTEQTPKVPVGGGGAAGFLPPLAQDLEGFTDDPWTPGPARKPNPPQSRNETQAQSASAEGLKVCGAAAAKVDPRQDAIAAFLAEHPHCADELSRRGDTATRSRVGLEYSVVCGWIAEPDTMPEKPAPAPKKHTKEELAALAAEMEKRNDEMYWRRREKESGKTRDQIIAGLSPVPSNESRWLNQLAAGVPN